MIKRIRSTSFRLSAIDANPEGLKKAEAMSSRPGFDAASLKPPSTLIPVSTRASAATRVLPSRLSMNSGPRIWCGFSRCLDARA
jgi:hypothetical protein